MSRKKLDLNNLLAKYQGHSSTSNLHSRYQEPFKETARKVGFEDQFYQHRTYTSPNEKPTFLREENTTTTSFKGHFNMSKSEVEQFLLSIKEELKMQYAEIPKIKEHALRQCLDKFQRNHDKIRIHVLQLMEKAFHQNERAMREELNRQAKVQTNQFTLTYKRIGSIQAELNRLLNDLKGLQYRKAIAEVVTRDFNTEVNLLKQSLGNAKKSYTENLGQIQIDNSRIDIIRDCISKIFFRKKGKEDYQIKVEQESGFFSIFKDKTKAQNNLDPNQSRMRKSFFNFG